MPRCTAADPSATCTCKGLLAYVGGEWVHVDVCLDCLTGPGGRCQGRHSPVDPDGGPCDDPQPAVCVHEEDWQCRNPAEIHVKCAYALPDQTCCGCCWADEYPLVDDRDLVGAG
jgi:hypothetical protein